MPGQSNFQPNGLLAFAQCKCPHCRAGDVFTHGAFNLKNFSKNHRQCPVCGFVFEKETGFFWGAMYISYAFSVAIAVTISVAIAVLFPAAGPNVYIAAVIASVVLLSTLSLRYSRLIMVYFFTGVKFDPAAHKGKRQHVNA